MASRPLDRFSWWYRHWDQTFLNACTFLGLGDTFCISCYWAGSSGKEGSIQNRNVPGLGRPWNVSWFPGLTCPLCQCPLVSNMRYGRCHQGPEMYRRWRKPDPNDSIIRSIERPWGHFVSWKMTKMVVLLHWTSWFAQLGRAENPNNAKKAELEGGFLQKLQDLEWRYWSAEAVLCVDS